MENEWGHCQARHRFKIFGNLVLPTVTSLDYFFSSIAKVVCFLRTYLDFRSLNFTTLLKVYYLLQNNLSLRLVWVRYLNGFHI